MLQSLVAPMTILAASGMIASNCDFDSNKPLSHTESVYSSNVRMNEMYNNFPSDFLLTLNLRTLRRLSLVKAFRDILLTCHSCTCI